MLSYSWLGLIAYFSWLVCLLAYHFKNLEQAVWLQKLSGRVILVQNWQSRGVTFSRSNLNVFSRCAVLGLCGLPCHECLVDSVNKEFSPGWGGSVDWVLACERRGVWFEPLSGHVPGLQVSGWGPARGNRLMSPSHINVSLHLSLPPFPSLKINK